MSVQEIKEGLRRLSLVERAEVQRYLRVLRWQEDPEMPARIDAAQPEMDAGRKVSEEQLLARIAQRREQAA